jgi:hypothetical protein
MINQIASVRQKTVPLTGISKGLIQARHIQAHVREIAAVPPPETGLVSSPLTGMPYLVPILHWIE